ncbi:hypothetical protein ACUH9Y_07870 [Dermabacteraceae bacterium P13115]
MLTVRSATRRFAAVALIATATLGFSGCTYLNAVQTSEFYQAADGTNANVGNAELRNLVLISAGKGKPATLVGALAGLGNEPVSVTLTGSYEGSSVFTASLTVQPNELAEIGYGSGARVFVDNTPVIPGGVMTITATVGSESKEFTLPVMSNKLDQYKNIELPSTDNN